MAALMAFEVRVAIQGPIEVRDAAGGFAYTYENVAGKEDVPARIIAQTEERRGERMTIIEDRFTVLLGGVHSDVTTDMVVVAGDDGVFDILRVVPAARRARPVTQLLAERISV
jgi:hypothetical protein